MAIFKFFAAAILVAFTTVANCSAQSSSSESERILGHPANEVGDFDNIGSRTKNIRVFRQSSPTSVRGKLIGSDADRWSPSAWGNLAPYMADLQHRIREYWSPPKGDETKRVVVLFKIHKGGELSNLRLAKSSGITAADNAALKAVKDAAPFRPLSPTCKDKLVDIEFTFDYNVFRSAGSK